MKGHNPSTVLGVQSAASTRRVKEGAAILRNKLCPSELAPGTAFRYLLSIKIRTGCECISNGSWS